MSVYKKLQEARVALQRRKLTKSGKNTFAGYQYFELGDFLPAVQEIFNEIGLCGIITFGPDIAIMEVVCTEDTEQRITFTSPMGSAQLKGCHEVQNIGAVETYQRRYLWQLAMEIVEHDALDAMTGNAQKTGKTMPITPTTGVVEEYSAQHPEDFNYLKELAAELVDFVEVQNDVGKAFMHLQKAKLDNEQTLCLAGLLAPNSKTRNSIKAERKRRESEAEAIAEKASKQETKE